MKRLLYIAMAAIVLTFVGCDENSVEQKYSGDDYLNGKTFTNYDNGIKILDFGFSINNDRLNIEKGAVAETYLEWNQQTGYYKLLSDSTFSIYNDKKYKDIRHEGKYFGSYITIDDYGDMLRHTSSY